MKQRHAVGAWALVAALTPVRAQEPGWVDASPHRTSLVDVEVGVQVEVLDWGGSGPPLMLLTGLGDTAHVFDEVGATLAQRYRVVGVTRRGHRGSSAPATGYEAARLAGDLVQIMDAMRLDAPVVVGHSFAGEEMHVLGSRHSSRVAGLVYVDAAFNRSDVFAEYESLLRTFAPAPRPEPPDLASFGTLRAFLTRTQGPPGPEARLRARYVSNPDGSVRGPWTPPQQVMQALGAGLQSVTRAYNPEPIRVPALAIYAVPTSTDSLMRPWYNRDDPEVRERVERLDRLERENVTRHARWFGTLAERSRIVEVPGGHDLFVTSAEAMIEEIETFVASLLPK